MWRDYGDKDDPLDRPEVGFVDSLVQDKLREQDERNDDMRAAEIADALENF